MGSYYSRYASDRDPTEECYDWPLIGVPGDQLCEDGLDFSANADYSDERWKETEYPNIWCSTKGRFYNTETKSFVDERPDRHGHLHLNINNSPPYHQPSSHRIIASMFIDNSNNYELVRHLDDDPTNNDVCNLAWGTRKENYQDSVENGGAYIPQEEDWLKSNEITRRPLLATNLVTGEILYFKSQADAAKNLGVSQRNISNIIRGGYGRHSAGGYSFRELSREEEKAYI